MPGNDLAGVMIVLVVAGVIGFVGLQVMDTVVDSTTVTGNLTEANKSLEGAFGDAFGLISVAFLVLILSVIVTYLYGLRGR